MTVQIDKTNEIDQSIYALAMNLSSNALDEMHKDLGRVRVFANGELIAYGTEEVDHEDLSRLP